MILQKEYLGNSERTIRRSKSKWFSWRERNASSGRQQKRGKTLIIFFYFYFYFLLLNFTSINFLNEGQNEHHTSVHRYKRGPKTNAGFGILLLPEAEE